ncbi:MAG: L-threonine 3-dehydrogenase [Angelakisella sp.]
MSELMNALVKATPDAGLTLQKVPVPAVGKNDVKIKVIKTAICGTDVHIYNWNDWAQRTIHTPMTIGHEFVGRIVEVGDNVTAYKVGERVSGEGHITCHTCRNCLEGKAHLCAHTKGVGVNRDGAFAEYLVIPQTNVVLCPDDISDDLCSCFDPLGNAVHTALSYEMVGEDVLITGAGPIGIMAAAICCHIGAKNVVITDRNEYRLSLVREMTRAYPLNIETETIPAVMRQLGMKEGFDVGLEMSGNGAALGSMVDNMYNGGSIAVLGLQEAGTPINWDKVIFNGLNIRGIYGRKVFSTWYKMMSMLQSGLAIDKIITHRFDYTEFAKGFDAMNSGRSGKVVLNWE